MRRVVHLVAGNATRSVDIEHVETHSQLLRLFSDTPVEEDTWINLPHTTSSSALDALVAVLEAPDSTAQHIKLMQLVHKSRPCMHDPRSDPYQLLSAASFMDMNEIVDMMAVIVAGEIWENIKHDIDATRLFGFSDKRCETRT